MADSQPPANTEGVDIPAAGATVLKRPYSQLALDYEDEIRPLSSSSSTQNGPQNSRSNQATSSSSSQTSPRHGSDDRPDRSKRARSAEFERDRDDGHIALGIPRPSSQAGSPTTSGAESSSSSLNEAWAAGSSSMSEEPHRETFHVTQTQSALIDNNYTILRPSQRSSPPRRAFVHRHSQRRSRLFAREPSPSVQDGSIIRSRDERGPRPPGEVVMISDTESDDQMSLLGGNVTQATASSGQTSLNYTGLPPIATLFPENRSNEEDLDVDTPFGNVDEHQISNAGQSNTDGGFGSRTAASTSPRPPPEHRPTTQDLPPLPSWYTPYSHLPVPPTPPRNDDDGARSRVAAPLSPLLPPHTSTLPSPEEIFNIADTLFSDESSSSGTVRPPQPNRHSASSEPRPSGEQHESEINESSSTSVVAPLSPSRPAGIVLFGELDRAVDDLDAFGLRSLSEHAAASSHATSTPSVAAPPTPREREIPFDPLSYQSLAGTGATTQPLRDPENPETVRASSLHEFFTARRLPRTPVGPSSVFQHARLIVERERAERRRTTSLPSNAALGSTPAPTISGSGNNGQASSLSQRLNSDETLDDLIESGDLAEIMRPRHQSIVDRIARIQSRNDSMRETSRLNRNMLPFETVYDANEFPLGLNSTSSSHILPDSDTLGVAVPWSARRNNEGSRLPRTAPLQTPASGSRSVTLLGTRPSIDGLYEIYPPSVIRANDALEHHTSNSPMAGHVYNEGMRSNSRMTQSDEGRNEASNIFQSRRLNVLFPSSPGPSSYVPDPTFRSQSPFIIQPVESRNAIQANITELSRQRQSTSTSTPLSSAPAPSSSSLYHAARPSDMASSTSSISSYATARTSSSPPSPPLASSVPSTNLVSNSAPGASSPLRQVFPSVRLLPQPSSTSVRPPLVNPPPRPSVGHRRQMPFTDQDRLAALDMVSQINVFSGLLNHRVASNPSSSDTTLVTAHRVLALLETLADEIRADVLDPESRRDNDGSGPGSSSTAGPRTILTSRPTGTDSGFVENLGPSTSSMRSEEPTRLLENRGETARSAAERRPLDIAQERRIDAPSRQFVATNTRRYSPTPGNPTSTSPVSDLLSRISQARHPHEITAILAGISPVPNSTGNPIPPPAPRTSPASTIPLTPAMHRDRRGRERAIDLAVSVSSSPRVQAEDQWGRERRRRQELESALLDRSSTLYSSRDSARELPAHRRAATTTNTRFPPTSYYDLYSSFGPGFGGNDISTFPSPNAHRTNSTSGNREERANTIPQSNPGNVRSFSPSPFYSGNDPDMGSPTFLRRVTPTNTPVRVGGPAQGRTESRMDTMDIDSDEEVNMLFRDTDSMVVESIPSAETREPTMHLTESPIGDNVVAHSHQRHRAPSTTNNPPPTLPAASRREIDLNAYHNGPMRATLARTLALQRRRQDLARERERNSSSTSVGRAGSSTAHVWTSLRSSETEQQQRSGTATSTPSTNDISRSRTTWWARSLGSHERSGSSIRRTGSMAPADEDDEDIAEIDRLLVEPPSSTSGPRSARQGGRGDISAIDIRRGEWMEIRDQARAAGLPSAITNMLSPTSNTTALRNYLRHHAERFATVDTPVMPSIETNSERLAARPPLIPTDRPLGQFHDLEFRQIYDSLRSEVRAGGRGIPERIINNLPSGTYGEWATPESDERCPICFEDYAPQEPVLRLPNCSHWFHKPCLVQWLKTARTCPMCRAPVESGHDRYGMSWLRSRPAFRMTSGGHPPGRARGRQRVNSDTPNSEEERRNNPSQGPSGRRGPPRAVPPATPRSRPNTAPALHPSSNAATSTASPSNVNTSVNATGNDSAVAARGAPRQDTQNGGSQNESANEDPYRSDAWFDLDWPPAGPNPWS